MYSNVTSTNCSHIATERLIVADIEGRHTARTRAINVGLAVPANIELNIVVHGLLLMLLALLLLVKVKREGQNSRSC
jgi:hypothetical protein